MTSFKQLLIDEVLAESVNVSSVKSDLKSFRLPKERSGFHKDSNEPIRLGVREGRNGIVFSVDFRRWGEWSAPRGSRFGPEDRDFHEIDGEDLRAAREAWRRFISNQSWSQDVKEANVQMGEKEYLYCKVTFDPQDVEGFDGRETESLKRR